MRVPRADAIEQIRVWIAVREEEYGVSSAEMLRALQNAERAESPETTAWMFWYRTLQSLTI
jgi:hypothetical protein